MNDMSTSQFGAGRGITAFDIENGIRRGRRLRAQAVRDTVSRVRHYFTDNR
jgi:hypothetical protein